VTDLAASPVYALLSASDRFSVKTGLMLCASLLELPDLSDADRRLVCAELRDIVELLERRT